MLDFCSLCPECSEAIRSTGAGCTGTCPNCVDIYYETPDCWPVSDEGLLDALLDERLEEQAAAEEARDEVAMAALEDATLDLDDLADRAQDAAAEVFLAVMDERAARADTAGGTL